MNYQDVMAEALNQQNGIIAGAPPVNIPPPLTSGTPMVDQSTLQMLMQKALQTPDQQQLSPDAMSSARMKMWAAMAQPRQQGQSTAGNVIGALAQGTGAVDQAKAAQQQMSMQQAIMGNTVATQDAQRRQHEIQMQTIINKYPEEFKQLQMQTEQLRRTGKTQELQILKTAFDTNAEVLMQDLKNRNEKAKGDLAHVGAQTAEETAKAGFYERGGQPKQGMTKLEDGTVLRHTSGPGGKVDVERLIPGNVNYTPAMAKKELEAEQKAKDSVWFRPGRMGLPDITDEEIAKRVLERQKDRVVKFQPVDTPSAATPGVTPNSTPTPDLTGKVRKLVDLQSGVPRQSTGKITGLPSEKPVGSSGDKPIIDPGGKASGDTRTNEEVRTSMKVSNRSQLALDQQALALLEQELAVANDANDVTEVTRINKDMDFRRARIKKLAAS